ncbi:MAG: glycosyltransferase [Flammeovirgaceae bacterium]|nr:MAG: glycosyltransferase [Flammeovirgaceae bacterium]
MNEPLVSACLITYNQIRYIRQSIEGILMQQTNFPWELIIADDCSTDGTQEILKEYKNRHSDKIKLLLQSKNKGAMLNWIDLVTTPRSRYITLCEGDDYWTDPLKLQKQVDFLESNPDYVACFHSVMVVDANGNEVRKSKNSFVHNRDLTREELIMGRVMSTLSLCYRNVITEFPEEFYKSPTGDNFLCSLLGNYGKAKFLKDIKPSAYRMHAGGSWSLQNEDKKKMTLLLSYFWLWQYYARIGRPEYAQGYYRKILLEGFYSNPFKVLVPAWLGRAEWLTIKTIRRVFRLVRNLFGMKAPLVPK